MTVVHAVVQERTAIDLPYSGLQKPLSEGEGEQADFSYSLTMQAGQ